MKKLSVLILIIALVLVALVACNDTPQNPGDTTTTGDIGENPAGDALTKAKDYLYSMYKENDGSVTGADFERVGVVNVDGVTYTVEWTVDNDKIKIVPNGKMVTIDVDEKSATEEKYTLTATVKDANGNTATCSFKHTVPAYAVNTWAEYAAAEKGTNLTVQGVVTAIISKSNDSTNNCLYIQDADGGYYIYGLTNDPITDGIKLGMTVEAKGEMDIYNGTLELKNASVSIVDETIKTVAPVDYTEIYKNAATLKDTALVEKQGMLVTVKGVELQAQSTDDVSGNYYRFKIGEKSSYVRLSGSTSPINNAEKETFTKAFSEHIGYTADVTGIICVYDGAFYLLPVTADAYTNFAMPERSDKEKAEFELEGLEIEKTITSDSEITVPVAGTTYTNVTLSWASSDAAATVNGGKIAFVVPDEAKEFKITVTATCGSATATKEFTVKLSKTITPIKDALEIGGKQEHNKYTADKYLIAGVITDLQSDKYGNMVITDETGATILIYGTYDATGANRYDAMAKKPVVGDYIVALGILGQYNGTAQMKNGWITTHVTPTSVSGAIELGNTFEKDKYSADKHLVSGKITEVKNDKYGNVVIADADGKSILVYGLYSSNGVVRYDAMTTKPVVGDTITVLGIVGKYDDAQLKNAWLIAHTTAAGGEQGGAQGGEAPTGDATISFADTAIRTEFSTEAQKWVSNGITFTNEKGASTSNVADYSNPVRCYKSSNIKVDFAGMKTVVFVCNNTSYADALKAMTVSGATVTADGKNVTFTFAAAVDTFTITGLGAQVRIDSIVISK